jgi:hypothetical protein
VNELSKGKQDGEFMKDISDGTGIKFKVMYGITDIMPITFNFIIVSNNTLKIDCCNGIARRLKTAQMDSDFKDDVEEDDYTNCVFKKDRMFGEKLQTIYKHDLMALIYEYSQAFVTDGYKMKPYPKEWKEETDNIVADSDQFSDFFHMWFTEEQGAQMAKKNVDELLKELNKGHVNFKDELKRIKVNFKYNSQGRMPGSSVKGVYEGFRKRTDMEMDNDEGDEL